MAISANTVWEIRSTGSDSNSGGFVAGAAGTDFSLQNSAAYSGTDLVVDASNNLKVTSASHTFGNSDIGNILRITAGAGWTTGFYQITGVDGLLKCTLDRSPAAVNTTGGSYIVGGAFASPGQAGAPGTGSVYIKSGTYTITSASTNVSGGCLAISTGSGQFVEGYQTTRGDLGTPPLLQASGINTFTLVGISGTNNGYKFTNLSVDGASLTSSRGFDLTRFCRAYKLKASNCTNNGINCGSSGFFPAIFFCSATGCSTQPAINGSANAFGCEAYSNTVTGFSTGISGAWSYCLSYNNSGASSDGFIIVNTNGAGSFYNCVAYNNGRAGFRLSTSTQVSNTWLINCVAVSNAGVGFDNQNSACPLTALSNCAAKDNSSAMGTGFTGLIVGSILAPSNTIFTNAGSGDFSLNNTAGGGASLRAAGFPGVFPTATTTGYLDIGAAQHADPTTAPSVILHPVNKSVAAGSNVSFYAAASGNPAPTLQWQLDSGSGYGDIGGQTATTLTLSSVSGGMNGNKYRAVFTNTAGSATSNGATLTVT